MEMTIRASSLGGLFDCPARFEAVQINHITMPRNPKNVIGNAVHHACAAFDVARMCANPIPINEASSLASKYIHDVQEDVDWGDDNITTTCRKAQRLVNEYCANIAPMFDFVMVEPADLRPVQLEREGVRITFTGTPDRAYQSFDGGYGGADLKTGVSVVDAAGNVETVKHLAQAAVYTILIEQNYDIELTEPFQILGMNTTSQRFEVGLMSTNLKEFLLGNPSQEQRGLIDDAAAIFKSGLFFGNPRSMMCHCRYCPIFNSCKYRGNQP